MGCCTDPSNRLLGLLPRVTSVLVGGVARGGEEEERRLAVVSVEDGSHDGALLPVWCVPRVFASLSLAPMHELSCARDIRLRRILQKEGPHSVDAYRWVPLASRLHQPRSSRALAHGSHGAANVAGVVDGAYVGCRGGGHVLNGVSCQVSCQVPCVFIVFATFAEFDGSFESEQNKTLNDIQESSVGQEAPKHQGHRANISRSGTCRVLFCFILSSGKRKILELEEITRGN